jgi:hypothetical protein
LVSLLLFTRSHHFEATLYSSGGVTFGAGHWQNSQKLEKYGEMKTFLCFLEYLIVLWEIIEAVGFTQ